MTHVITQACCNDAACVPVCPADCIHPAESEPGFASAEMLWIDPEECIDCGACADVCPVDAIYPENRLPDDLQPFVEINSMLAHLRRGSLTRGGAQNAPTGRRAGPSGRVEVTSGPLRVAIVGTGPSAVFAAEELLATAGPGVRVSIFDRLPVAGGLIRFGVSPDHVHTKRALRRFPQVAQDPRVSLFLNVEIGGHIQVAELLEHHHAVIVAVGAAGDRKLGVAGEDLPGSHAAREFVAWYNGHPDHADAVWDLSGERVVVIGNGNVALDVARVLTAHPDELAATDIAEHALRALRESNVREVVVVGRRGPESAAFTFPELVGLSRLTSTAVRASGVEPADAVATPRDPAGFPSALKTGLVADLARRRPDDRRTIELRFLRSPDAILGSGSVTGVRLGLNRTTADGIEPTGETEVLSCGLVLRSIGYEVVPMPGLPFDEHRRTIPHAAGRVTDPGTGEPLAGLYATGWVKRGPSGVIGTNRPDARETVAGLLDDFRSGHLARPAKEEGELAALVSERRPRAVDLKGWLEMERIACGGGRP
ncbi:4Fe-4S binding protein [Actinomadura rugatobispora]|uniref:ferredoxin--NADP(+) reductase n=1 Tax=Actinomadura rugatobispora TaxID=1994 RepID=A0ABW0ZVD9_9ACTN|nr:FAD-dependent oxidoreductase [Actinomadura rugatobispora]